MSSIFNYLKSGSSDCFGMKKDEKMIFKKPISQEEKCKQLFLQQEFFAIDETSFNTNPPVWGWHGTSSVSLGSQMDNWELENKNMPVYFDSFETAKAYAQARARYRGGEPIVLKIASDDRPKMNDFMDVRLGAYLYIPPSKSQKVVIEEAWTVSNSKNPPIP